MFSCGYFDNALINGWVLSGWILDFIISLVLDCISFFFITLQFLCLRTLNACSNLTCFSWLIDQMGETVTYWVSEAVLSKVAQNCKCCSQVTDKKIKIEGKYPAGHTKSKI